MASLIHKPTSTSGLQALYRVFVLPAITNARPQRPPHGFAVLSTPTQRHLSNTSHRLGKYRAPEQRQKWNEEITARMLRLVDPITGAISPEPVTRFDVLKSLDVNTHRLVQITDENIPICKIFSKKDMYEREKEKKQQAKEKKKLAKTAESMKTLELNWAIDENDLNHRLDKVKEFLADGRRVEIVLAAKKKGRGRQATLDECKAVLDKIAKNVDSVKGARELKALEGKVGGFATLTLQGAAPTNTQQSQPEAA
ncbi:Hypothetical protein R9X50_00266700 [Acrodontium crateriforme]|uniref:Translation initiation factor 3 N-terminal domain-containing protein n=1 Tax=Acrodontium crateriforme TaxID=150365 RepID=A0AAQ3RB64_9PEZI|nr:Hypothetical protein R9X50_00266700 [Acrodontium crateriforme]